MWFPLLVPLPLLVTHFVLSLLLLLLLPLVLLRPLLLPPPWSALRGVSVGPRPRGLPLPRRPLMLRVGDD